MGKAVMYLGFIGFVLMFVATVRLVTLNWNERLYGPLFSILLGGTVTTFITVLALLKESKVEAASAMFVVWDGKENLPLRYLAPHDAPGPRVHERLRQLADLGRP